MAIEFTKYHGLGNDFILIDNRASLEPCLTPEQAIKVCDRHFGIGADGVIFALPGQDDTDYTMRIFNSDGSEPEMCGNGIRCMARFVAELENGTRHKTLDTTEHAVESNQQTREQANQESEKALQSKIQNRSTERSRRSPKSKIQNLPPPTYRIHTLAGVMTPKLEANGLVTVDMGEPRLLAAEIPTTLGKPDQKVIDHSLEVAGQPWKVTCVSMGNPHCITFVEDVAAIPLDVLGPQFECHPAFPKKINTEFIQVVRSHDLKMRVWERGAGITLACGTGACAALVAAVLTGRSDRHATIELPGGSLQIEWAEASNRLYMTGPAERVFSGTMEP